MPQPVELQRVGRDIASKQQTTIISSVAEITQTLSLVIFSPPRNANLSPEIRAFWMSPCGCDSWRMWSQE